MNPHSPAVAGLLAFIILSMGFLSIIYVIYREK